ncbi:predicted protein [Candida tropicalis MYA-3404]|uniref:Uncharacterized protein n=1 Tax=Candida tropicalis (strain ATCC MYA-3404 / T1) TaxID=294747 RepID=C5M3A6_CANTT|nr:predicted protein [Candida tropicalis MYA-3404]EER35806.1 predicted protein [Candida tropicalis MYA-3404]KAG4409921.1 hypothetical protein JTP64_000559 [Candida tropicalis]
MLQTFLKISNMITRPISLIRSSMMRTSITSSVLKPPTSENMEISVTTIIIQNRSSTSNTTVNIMRAHITMKMKLLVIMRNHIWLMLSGMFIFKMVLIQVLQILPHQPLEMNRSQKNHKP